MSSAKRMLMLAGIGALALSLLMACTQSFWKSSHPDGGYIKLNVGSSGSKRIDVDYHDVTGLSITVYEPDGDELESFDWDAEDGPQTYLVPVNEAGTYRIEVTHIHDEDGAVVVVTEHEDFEIEAMTITVINVIPGVIGMVEVEGEDGGEPAEDGTLTVHLSGVVDPDTSELMDGIGRKMHASPASFGF